MLTTTSAAEHLSTLPAPVQDQLWRIVRAAAGLSVDEKRLAKTAAVVFAHSLNGLIPPSESAGVFAYALMSVDEELAAEISDLFGAVVRVIEYVGSEPSPRGA